MLESHAEAKSYLMFSAITILQQKIRKVNKIWIEDANLTLMLRNFCFLLIGIFLWVARTNKLENWSPEQGKDDWTVAVFLCYHFWIKKTRWITLHRPITYAMFDLKQWCLIFSKKNWNKHSFWRKKTNWTTLQKIVAYAMLV